MFGSNARDRDLPDEHIAARLVVLRRARGISQPALGEAIGVSFQQIQKYENAQNRIATSRLLRIARALDCEITDLFPRRTVDGVSGQRIRQKRQARKVSPAAPAIRDEARADARQIREMLARLETLSEDRRVWIIRTVKEYLSGRKTTPH